MRISIATTVAVALLLVSNVAGAYEMKAQLKAGSINPATAVVGQSLVYEIFLDTTNTLSTSRITLISVSFTYDPTVIAYDGLNSFADDYYPLYAAGVPTGKTVGPATWLEPFFNPPVRWIGNLPPGLDQVNVDFKEINLGTTTAMDTNQKLAEISFNTVGVGSGTPDFSFDNGGNIFQIDVVTSITDPGYAGPESIAATLVDGTTITVPEPGLAGLALGALGALGVLAARRRQH